MTSEAQFGLAKILRPFEGFGPIYDAQSGFVPIMFSENGAPFDDQAGKAGANAGYSKRLLRGLPTPYGARVSIWLPMVSPAAVGVSVAYAYTLMWRLRNVFDYRNARQAYHYPKQGVGAEDTVTGDDGDRVIIPVATQTIIVNDPSPTQQTQNNLPNDPGQVRATNRLIDETITPQDFTTSMPNQAAPFIPPVPGVSVNAGMYGQGVTPASDTDPAGFIPVPYQVYEVQAQGDELLIACNKIATSTATEVNLPAGTGWDFGGEDAMFFYLFGNGSGGEGFPPGPFPDVGIYVLVGAAT